MLILEKEALSFSGGAWCVCVQCALRVLELIAVEFDTRLRNVEKRLFKTAANAQQIVPYCAPLAPSPTF